MPFPEGAGVLLARGLALPESEIVMRFGGSAWERASLAISCEQKQSLVRSIEKALFMQDAIEPPELRLLASCLDNCGFLCKLPQFGDFLADLLGIATSVDGSSLLGARAPSLPFLPSLAVCARLWARLSPSRRRTRFSSDWRIACVLEARRLW
jgi:hypothetical protein